MRMIIMRWIPNFKDYPNAAIAQVLKDLELPADRK
jgi:hypothetical protein